MAIFDFIGDILTGGATAAAREAQRGLERSSQEQRRMQSELSDMYSPYLSATRGAPQEYLEAIQAMRDPQEFYSQMMEGYEMSPEAQLAMEEGTRAATQGASASGMLGSGELLKNLQKYGQQLSAADQQQWLKNMMGIYGGYTGGLGNLQSLGYQTRGTYGQQAGNISDNISNLLSQIGVIKGLGQRSLYALPGKALSSAMNYSTGGLSGLLGNLGNMFGTVSPELAAQVPVIDAFQS